jgi:hypothetical protein
MLSQAPILNGITADSKPSRILVSARRLEAEGVALDGAWKFRLGDNPSWSLPTFDDSDWATLDPSKPLLTAC